jgi:hypothetical protein
MTWEHDEIETCWIYPPVIYYNDTELLWTIEQDGVYVFEIEKRVKWQED